VTTAKRSPAAEFEDLIRPIVNRHATGVRQALADAGLVGVADRRRGGAVRRNIHANSASLWRLVGARSRRGRPKRSCDPDEDVVAPAPRLRPTDCDRQPRDAPCFDVHLSRSHREAGWRDVEDHHAELDESRDGSELFTTRLWTTRRPVISTWLQGERDSWPDNRSLARFKMTRITADCQPACRGVQMQYFRSTANGISE